MGPKSAALVISPALTSPSPLPPSYPRAFARAHPPPTSLNPYPQLLLQPRLGRGVRISPTTPSCDPNPRISNPALEQHRPRRKGRLGGH